MKSKSTAVKSARSSKPKKVAPPAGDNADKIALWRLCSVLRDECLRYSSVFPCHSLVQEKLHDGDVEWTTALSFECRGFPKTAAFANSVKKIAESFKRAAEKVGGGGKYHFQFTKERFAVFILPEKVDKTLNWAIEEGKQIMLECDHRGDRAQILTEVWDGCVNMKVSTFNRTRLKAKAPVKTKVPVKA